jgi:4-hydroxy-4-methyl-2-oxoglutarate aldolase
VYFTGGTPVERFLTKEQFDALQRLDACSVANAIESFQVRMRNEGFASDNSVKCVFKHFPPMLGYAVTGMIRTSAPPMASSLPPPRELRFVDHTNWWNHVLSIPSPRVVVMQDVDHSPGVGSFMGGVHASICKALGCIGYVTNGAVRDLASVERLGFHLFAGHVSVSHAYAHVVSFGEPVEVGGLRIRPGDLVHGDRHGIQTIPWSVAGEVAKRAAAIKEKERLILDFCRSAEFSVEKLRKLIKEVDASLRTDSISEHDRK